MKYIEKYKEAIKKFRIIDDTFMRKVFEDVSCVRLLVNVVLDRNDIDIISSQIQFDMKNLQGRSLTLDIFAQDSNGKKYNIEVQRSNNEANSKRARYHSSLIDANILDKNEDFKNLPETYVIFITENDVLKKGLPIYHIDRIIKETNEYFGDDSHIIYVNAQIQDQTNLGKLMHDFMCTKSEEMNYKELSGRTKYFKENEKGVTDMCAVMEELFNDIKEDMKEEYILVGMEKGMEKGKKAGILEGIERGKEIGILEGMEKGKEAGILEGIEKGIEKGKEAGLLEGKEKENYEIVKRMLKSGKYSEEEISLIADISIEKIRKIASEI